MTSEFESSFFLAQTTHTKLFIIKHKRWKRLSLFTLQPSYTFIIKKFRGETRQYQSNSFDPRWRLCEFCIMPKPIFFLNVFFKCRASTPHYLSLSILYIHIYINITTNVNIFRVMCVSVPPSALVVFKFWWRKEKKFPNFQLFSLLMTFSVANRLPKKNGKNLTSSP